MLRQLANDERIQAHGLCQNNAEHEPHIFWLGFLNNLNEKVMQECPGQYVDCRNCDDRKCMGCIFREYNHECKDDCPMCCKEPV